MWGGADRSLRQLTGQEAYFTIARWQAEALSHQEVHVCLATQISRPKTTTGIRASMA